MDNMAYLQQISNTSKPAPAKKSALPSFIGPKFFIGLGIFIVLIIFIAAIASMLNNVKDREKEESMRLYARSSYLLGALNSYTGLVKSSQLRAMGNTLSTHLTELNRDFLPLLTNYWGYEDWEDDTPPEILEEESNHYSELIGKLENARINGLLDRVYVRELALEIALLNSIQSEIMERSEKEDFDSVLENSYNNITQLHEQFSDYSDPSN